MTSVQISVWGYPVYLRKQIRKIFYIFLGFLIVGCSAGTSISFTGSSGVADFQKTTITSGTDVAANGLSSHVVTILLKNSDDSVVANYLPTFDVTPSAGVVIGACSVSNVLGYSTCSLKSTIPGVKTISLTNAKLAESKTFNFLISEVTMTGLSAPTTTAASRLFATTWTLTGGCDPGLGAVQIGGNGIATAYDNAPSTTTPCNANNTFSVVINATCGAAPCMNHYSNEVTAFQTGGKFTTTRIYPFASATIVTTAAQLQAALVPGATVLLANDIDLSSIPNWTPIDASGGMQLFGDGHTISNLTINAGAASQVGFFSKGNIFLMVSDVKFTNAAVTTTGGQVGGVIGYANNSQLFNVSYSGSVNGSSRVGGLIGYQVNGNAAFIKDCTTSGTVTATGAQAGGLIGQGYDTSGVRNYSTANVSGSTKVGGLVGEIGNSVGGGPIKDSEASGSITCTGVGCLAGGLFGSVTGKVITQTYFSGTVHSPASGVTDMLAGAVDVTTTVTNSYYLQGQTCDQCTFALGTSLTAAQMKLSSSYVGWDFALPFWVNATEGVTFPLPKR